jgi:hypothetical protein
MSSVPTKRHAAFYGSTRAAAALVVAVAFLVGCHSSSTRGMKPAMDEPTGGAQPARDQELDVGERANWPSVAELRYRAFQQTGSADAEAKTIGYDPSHGTQVKVRRAWVTPAAADPGNSITSEMEYTLLGSGNELEIAEEWEILKDGKPLTSTAPRMERRHPGGWRVTVAIGLPRGAKPGAYVVRSRVSAGKLADSRDSGFTVTAGVTSLRQEPKEASGADTGLITLQARLKELGHDPGPADGIARAQTQAALKAFQKDYELPATGEPDAETLAALALGTPSEKHSCEKAHGSVKDHLRNPADPSSQQRAIEVCDTGADYRLDGVIVIAKNADHPAFAETALDDLSKIASISDPKGHVGFDFLVQLVGVLRGDRLPAAERGIYVRWGGAPSKSKRSALEPFTRPGSSGSSTASAEWRAATAQGLDVYGDDGTPSGGAGQLFKGLAKGTGGGVGASVFYQPESFSDLAICPSGMTSDVALFHELQHAARMASGEVDNTPYSNKWWNQDPLATSYGVHEERFIVERENEYRTALKQKYPDRYANLRSRERYPGDC